MMIESHLIIEDNACKDELFMKVMHETRPVKRVEISDGMTPKRVSYHITLYKGNEFSAVICIQYMAERMIYTSENFEEINDKFFELISHYVQRDM